MPPIKIKETVEEQDERVKAVIQGKYTDKEDVKPKKGIFINSKNEDDKKVRDVRSGADYKQLKQAEQIYRRPDTMIGSTDPEEREEEVFNPGTGKIERSKIETPFGIIHLFMEIISNAADNADFTRRADPDKLPPKLVKKLKDVGKIEVTIDKKRIKIRNGGIPIVVSPGVNVGDKLIPLTIFGELNSSTNYDDDETIRTGSGRNGVGSKGCFRANTLIPLYNGSLKKVQDIDSDDLLIGDDGTPRNIIALVRGKSTMYEITSPRGMTYIVNGSHLLTVRMEDHKVIFWNQTRGGWTVLWLNKEEKTINRKQITAFTPSIICSECGISLSGNMKRHYTRMHPEVEYIAPPRKSPTTEAPDTEEVRQARREMEEFCKTIPDDNTLDITVKEYMKLTKTIQSRLTGFRGECVKWPKQKVHLDPYVLGLWLGDGMQDGYGFANDADNDYQIMDYLKEWGKNNDAYIRLIKGTKYNHTISSINHYGKKGKAPLKKLLRIYDLEKEKHVPREYLVNDRETRLAVLAGMIDTDGHVANDGSRITITQGMNHTRLAYDIVHLARSLGFMCNSHIRDTQWEYKGELKRGKAICINISGDNIWEIPTLLPRKKCKAPIVKNVTNNGVLSVKKLDKENFYGFRIDGNKRFVLEDFTVVHNCNIFSSLFRVAIGDSINGQEFEAIWTGNMTELSYLSVTPGYKVDKKGYYVREEDSYVANEGKKYKGEPYVEIEYELDFERFGYKKYPTETFGILAQRTLFMAMSTKMLVSINGIDYDVRNIRDFAKMRFDEDICKNAIIHYEWPVSGKGKNKSTLIPERFEKMKASTLEKAIMNPESPDEIPTVELMALDTENGIVLSSVNGQYTPEDGVHVTEAFRAVAGGVIEKINNTFANMKEKKKKGKEEKEIKIPQLDIKNVKNYISLIVSCRLMDTRYSTQTKVKLTKPKPNISIDPKTLSKVDKWRLVERLHEEIQEKLGRAMKKTDGKKKKHINPDKGEDAYHAGSSKSLDCVLYWAEGDSATNYPKQRILNSPGGKDFAGYFPGKGKFINICKASPDQLINNTEINRFKQFTGVFEGIDVTKKADKAKMRYGSIIIATDADKDGQHILMLRINYIYKRFKSLIDEGMIAYIETPYARALKGKGNAEKCLEVFRNENQLLSWLEENKSWFNNGQKGHWIKYYKGLASSRTHDIKQDIDSAPIVVVVCDDTAFESLDLAFGLKNEDRRKEWISKWRNATGIRDIVLERVSKHKNLFKRDITTLCNYNLIDYSKETYFRALPSYEDGLKESQRKALAYALIKWAYGKGRAGSDKTGRIASECASKMSYHYNENCLTDTYTRMAQDFTGSHNMAYFTPEGQLGSRHEGGNDAGACRYTEIDIAPWIKYVYDPDFLKVVKRRTSEGLDVEPEWLPSVIPMHIINGFKGIATAYSTYGPCHNPFDVIDWLRDKCNGNKPDPIKPWYNGFTGRIVVKKKGKQDEEESDSEEEKEEASDEEEDSEEDEERKKRGVSKEESKEEKARRKMNKIRKGKLGMTTYGVFEVEGDTITITDLPIGIWVYNYRKWLEKLREEGTITEMRENSPDNKVYIVITGFKEEANYKNLKLYRGEGLSNMVLIDKDGYPKMFKNNQEILETFYANMVKMFKKLKKLYVQEIKEAIHDIEQRILFIESHNKGILVIKNKEDDEVYAKMDELKIERKYYDIIKARDFSNRKLEELREQIKSNLVKLKELEKTTPEMMWIAYLDKLEAGLTKLKICMREKKKKTSSSTKKIKIVEE
jgi:DNA topoisomerase II